MSSLADNWNPSHPLGNEADYTTSANRCATAPWNIAADGTPTLDTDFVLESSTETVPGQPFTVTYTLNPDAHWNNGDPIDVDDYIANWHALNGVEPGFEVVATEGYDQITSVEQGADEFEVVITFDDVYPDYQALFDGRCSPAEAVADPARTTTGWARAATLDWFTGPFIVDSYDAAQGIVELVPEPQLVGRAPLLDKIIFRVVSPTRRRRRSPTASSTPSTSAPTRTASPSQHHAGRRPIRAAAGPNWRHITFNTEPPV